MFSQWPWFPIDFYFPILRDPVSKNWVHDYVAEVSECLKMALDEARSHQKVEAKRQKHYYDHATGSAILKAGDIVL